MRGARGWYQTAEKTLCQGARAYIDVLRDELQVCGPHWIATVVCFIKQAWQLVDWILGCLGDVSAMELKASDMMPGATTLVSANMSSTNSSSK